MSFEESVQVPLIAGKTTTLQINMGYLCNLACKHCHVGASAERKEVTSRNVLEGVLSVLRRTDIPVVDITGGAPEMNPNFRWFLDELAMIGRSTTVRTNLVILDEDGYTDLPEVYKKYKIELVASLPALDSSKADRQRGSNVHSRSISMLKKLNSLGYAMPDSGLRLNLVHNPTGAYMTGNQEAIEHDYRKRLLTEHGIRFNNLYCITNMPVGRFESYLLASNNYEEYMNSLIEAFNIKAVDALMCKNTVSVDWQGRLYDCDFNQCKGMPVSVKDADIWTYDPIKMEGRRIVVGEHCYGCTAGAGSSCRGSTVNQ